MGFKVIPTRCPVCNGEFMAESYQMFRSKQKGKLPTCSKKCEQERRHKESRDRKWAQQLQKKLSESPKERAR